MKLIDADSIPCKDCFKENCKHSLCYDFAEWILNGTRIVLCKDCKHSKQPGNTAIGYGLPGTLTCVNPNSPCHYRHVLEEGYCPYGERKDNG